MLGAGPPLAHDGLPIAPHDLWAAWNLDPGISSLVLLTIWLYVGGRRSAQTTRRDVAFGTGLFVLAIALISPLDALAGSLASAHMVQHLLLFAVAAPLFAVSRPVPTLMRGAPRWMRVATRETRRAIHLTGRRTRWFRHPGFAWTLSVATLWFWHARSTYEAALEYELVHLVEHASFLLAGLLFWSVVVNAGRPGRITRGSAVLLLFTHGLQTTLLAALMTFASRPWYPSYETTAPTWNLEPLSDQQLAGVLMWFPSSAIVFGAALSLLVFWLHEDELPSVRILRGEQSRPDAEAAAAAGTTSGAHHG